jgi:hypothetical protein
MDPSRKRSMLSNLLALKIVEREICPWAISISILVIKCPTHIL